jgi:adenosylcobinamide kinase/adenosylcobinamide-phosphate guanylyltransferase
MNAPGFALIGGGARSGKSGFALRLAFERGRKRLFLATAQAFDDEMRERIAAHVSERGHEFDTLEAPNDLDDVVRRLCRASSDVEVVVVDCLTMWLSNLLLAGVSFEDIDRRVLALSRSLAKAPFHSLVVTNEVGMGVVPDSVLGRRFRDISGRAHQTCASAATEVYFAALGTILRLKPGPIVTTDGGAPP